MCLPRLRLHVFFKNDNYQNFNIISQTFCCRCIADAPNDGGCFAGDTELLVESGHRKTMSHLNIGDRVLTVDATTGRAYYEDVVAMMHRVHG